MRVKVSTPTGDVCYVERTDKGVFVKGVKVKNVEPEPEGAEELVALFKR